MDKRYVFFGSLLNIVTLMLGITLGFLLGTVYSNHVHAQTTQKVEPIAPNLSAGSAAFGTLLAGRFAADEVGTHGIDLLKLDTNILNVLASQPMFFTHDQLQKAIDDAKTPTILQMKASNPPTPTPKPKEK